MCSLEKGFLGYIEDPSHDSLCYLFSCVRTSINFNPRFINFFNKCMSCQNDVVKSVASIGASNPVSCASNNYKLLLNDQNGFAVLDMIEWKKK